MSQYVTLALKRGTASEWVNANPILAAGEPGFELDTGKLKIGTGTIPWNSLSYLTVAGGTGATGVTGVTGVTGYNFSVPLNSVLWTPDGTSITGTVGLQYASGVGITIDVLNIQSPSTKVAIGNQAGNTGQGFYSLAVGNEAGSSGQGQNCVAIGLQAGRLGQQAYSVAIGSEAGEHNQGGYSTAIGYLAGQTGQLYNSVAIGSYAGQTNQLQNSVAIGFEAGYTGQGANSKAIGNQAGYNTQPANTIILDASGSAVNGVYGQTGSFYVAPIRSDPTKTVPLLYDPTTHEIVQGASGIMGPTGPTGTGLLSGITFCGLNFSQGSGGLFTPPFNVDISIPGLTNTSNVQVTAKLTDSGIEYPACSILYAETTTDTLTVYVSSNPNFDGYGLMWNVINF